MTDTPLDRLLARDPFLKPYAETLQRRIDAVARMHERLIGRHSDLVSFAAGHEHFGLHLTDDGWVLREWAPRASAIFLIGEMTDWQERGAFALAPAGPPGEWVLQLPAASLSHGDLYRLRIHWADGAGDRIPAWARRVVQDPSTHIANAQVWHPPAPYGWQAGPLAITADPPLIYEAHVGMAQEQPKIGTYREFVRHVLPRIAAAGYNTLQLMAILEHPYYASFGYQVSSFFAPSSRFGTPEDLKALIDAAHAAGLRVIMDLVHSHAVANVTEGLGLYDGTPYQFFHTGARGIHPSWGSRCFDYGNPRVLHFLLSNCRFWLDEYRLDGFRFDGVTSMLYRHHGLGVDFGSYDDYFNDSVDEDALAYLTLANRLIHTLRPDARTLAEDNSGLPALALPESEGGVGFDYRFAMGVPDYWIRLTKETPDEAWPLEHLWHELTNRRSAEKSISYCESHDQALVGDQTLMFRLSGAAMYDHMAIGDPDLQVERGVALHKMIRLITLASAGSGYLNFMGNEFGHPEWIDFPREGNAWSFHHARRQWHLVDEAGLKYSQLARFDRDMLALAIRFNLLGVPAAHLLRVHASDRVIAFERAGLLFVFNFHPEKSFTDYPVPVSPGKYRMVLDSDDNNYGGHGRLIPEQVHFTLFRPADDHPRHFLSLYLPTRTAIVLQPTG